MSRKSQSGSSGRAVFIRRSSGLVRSVSTLDTLFYCIVQLAIPYVMFNFAVYAFYPGASMEIATAHRFGRQPGGGNHLLPVQRGLSTLRRRIRLPLACGASLRRLRAELCDGILGDLLFRRERRFRRHDRTGALLHHPGTAAEQPRADEFRALRRQLTGLVLIWFHYDRLLHLPASQGHAHLLQGSKSRPADRPGGFPGLYRRLDPRIHGCFELPGKL